ncbi:MAG TPA: PKD domain-containing protein [Candidatus Acidoferrum sp.]|nr:PKD domain-containing protein [Candidatus Acidoferrum sp.]
MLSFMRAIGQRNQWPYAAHGQLHRQRRARDRAAQWTFEDGEFATNTNPVKTFRSPGTYHARLTVTDTNGNTAQCLVTINVNSRFDAWRAGKFTAAELANTNISGAAANTDSDEFPNLLEYAMGLDPKTPDPASTFSATLSNSLFTLSFPHYKPATDAPIVLEVSPDLLNWSSVATTQSLDQGLTEKLTHQETASAPCEVFPPEMLAAIAARVA